jgi:hypothetical protein
MPKQGKALFFTGVLQNNSCQVEQFNFLILNNWVAQPPLVFEVLYT